jgi:2-succinyl-5-enolpyruvyl-6-hydroxy-3-cyclohexene-1-carboxylate synthase
MNSSIVLKLENWLQSIAVFHHVICPGARNAPLVKHFEKGSSVSFWPEERSAAFFALGRAQREGRPCSVMTTSGTAAAELLAAAMEGYYTQTPLILITADRPKSLRVKGAPQTCVQPGLFSIYAPTIVDAEFAVELDHLPSRVICPVHLNLCFKEPL